MTSRTAFCASKLLSAFVLLLVIGGTPASAAAFSDYEVFGLPPLEGGGGGGRYFTASPIDGYGCGVCHTGGIKPVVQLRGLPEAGYVPGAPYDIELTWLFPNVPHSLNLEIVNAAGQAAGSIVLPDVLEPADRCTDMPGEPAAHLIEEAAPRRILWLNQCGSSRLRFRFVAPSDPEVTLAASMVRTDRSEKPEGDGAIEIRHVLRRQDVAAPDSGCTLSHSVQNRASGAWLLLTLGVVFALYRQRRRYGLG